MLSDDLSITLPASLEICMIAYYTAMQYITPQDDQNVYKQRLGPLLQDWGVQEHSSPKRRAH